MTQTPEFVPFGFKNIMPETKVDEVKSVFSAVASQYDIMNDAMSLGVHRLWKSVFISKITPYKNMSILDLAGGTGDITFRMAKKFPCADLTLSDINADMLAEGHLRADKLGLAKQITWAEANACDLPFESNSKDVITISFGLRNVTHIDQALSEAHRVLKPGGQFLCLEFSRVDLPFLREFYNAYSFNVIPKIRKLVAGNEKAYQYLVESIARFPHQEKLKNMMDEAKFHRSTYTNLTGGIAAIHKGWKI